LAQAWQHTLLDMSVFSRAARRTGIVIGTSAAAAVLAGAAVYFTAVARRPEWILTSSMEMVSDGKISRTETFKLQRPEDETRGWQVTQSQVSEGGGVKSVQETLTRIPPPPLIVKIAFGASVVGAVVAIMVSAVLALSAVTSALDCCAFTLVLSCVLSLFALLAFGASHANHVALGSALGCWASLVTTPLSFWTSVNMLGVLTRVVALCTRAYEQARLVYHWLLPGDAIDKLASSMLATQKMAPSLINPLIVGRMERPTSTEEWALQLQDLIGAHIRMEQYDALSGEVLPPELPQMPPFTGCRSILPCLMAWVKGIVDTKQMIKHMLEDGDGGTRLTTKDVIAFLRIYFRNLVMACITHARMQLCVSALFRKLSKEDAADFIRWRLVADQFTWCRAQKLSATDVAARVLHENPSMSTPLRMWLAADAALAWGWVLPGLWELPHLRREALCERMEVLAHLSTDP